MSRNLVGIYGDSVYRIQMIISLEQLGIVREKHINVIIGFCSGVYDLLHKGHINVIQQAKQSCDVLVVAVNDDWYVENVKGTTPVMNQDSRIQAVDSLPFVDYCCFLSTKDRAHIFENLKPDIIILPDNHETSLEDLRARGIRVKIVPYTKGISTTILKKLLAIITDNENIKQ